MVEWPMMNVIGGWGIGVAWKACLVADRCWRLWKPGTATGVVKWYTPTRTRSREPGIKAQNGCRGENGCRKAPTGVQLVKAEEVIDNTYKDQFRNIKNKNMAKMWIKIKYARWIIGLPVPERERVSHTKKRATIQTKSRGKERGWGEVLCPEQGSLFLAVSVA